MENLQFIALLNIFEKRKLESYQYKKLLNVQYKIEYKSGNDFVAQVECSISEFVNFCRLLKFDYCSQMPQNIQKIGINEK